MQQPPGIVALKTVKTKIILLHTYHPKKDKWAEVKINLNCPVVRNKTVFIWSKPYRFPNKIILFFASVD